MIVKGSNRGSSLFFQFHFHMTPVGGCLSLGTLVAEVYINISIPRLFPPPQQFLQKACDQLKKAKKKPWRNLVPPNPLDEGLVGKWKF